MPRLLLSDELWSKLKLILLQCGVYAKQNLRIAVEGMLYRLRTGLPWRDLPDYFGHWNSVYKKFNSWSARGVWKKVFNFLVIEPDLEWGFVDGSYVKAHQHSAGARGPDDQGIGLSRGGNTSKIHMVVDGAYSGEVEQRFRFNLNSLFPIALTHTVFTLSVQLQSI